MFQVLEPEFIASRWDVPGLRSDDRGAAEYSEGPMAFLDSGFGCWPLPRLARIPRCGLVAAMRGES